MLWSDGKWQSLTVYKVTILGEITSYLQVIQQSALENGDSGMFRLRMLVQFGMDESESEGAQGWGAPFGGEMLGIRNQSGLQSGLGRPMSLKSKTQSVDSMLVFGVIKNTHLESINLGKHLTGMVLRNS